VFKKLLSLGGRRCLRWNHELHPGFLWRFPDPSSPVEEERSADSYDCFVVALGEGAVALIGGKICSFDEGVYEIARGEAKKGLDIAFYRKGPVKMPWGVSHLQCRSADRQPVGGHGHFTFTVRDPEAFVLNMLIPNNLRSEEDVHRFLVSELQDIARRHLARYRVMDFELDDRANDIAFAIRAEFNGQFARRWGVEMENVEFKPYVPPEVDERRRKER